MRRIRMIMMIQMVFHSMRVTCLRPHYSSSQRSLDRVSSRISRNCGL